MTNSILKELEQGLYMNITYEIFVKGLFHEIS